LESVVGGEEAGEEEQNDRLTLLETASKDLSESLVDLVDYIRDTVDVNIATLTSKLDEVSAKVNNITELI
jgi:hypothetical protein